MRGRLETRIVTGVAPSADTPREVLREFRGLLEQGLRIRPAGTARRRPLRLLSQGYVPRHKLALFDATFYLTDLREDENFFFMVAYVRLGAARELPARLFFKDTSLVWRCATHFISKPFWIGKGDIKVIDEADGPTEYSAEETTNLPLEIQAALDDVSRKATRVPWDQVAMGRIVRRAPKGRYEAYADFIAPRRRAAAVKRNRIHGGAYVAWFARRNDPTSLRFAPGFAPDFARVLEVARSRSRLYGGEVRKFRILSRNQRIQYHFVATPRVDWINPPQTLTTELSSYGVRTLDVCADEDLFVPGYEYHFMEHGELYTQIPKGFAGKVSELDPLRADASPWLDRLPVIQEFRKRIPDPLAW